MGNALMIGLFMFMAMLIGNKIGHDAGKAIAGEACKCNCPPEPILAGSIALLMPGFVVRDSGAD